MTTFYITRHGQTENDKNKRFSGWIDSPLTDEGVHNAVSAATKLKGISFDKIISSDLGRAFITAYIISREFGYTAGIERVPDLREVNYGELANKPYADYPDLAPPQNADYVVPGGESLVQMQTRVLNYLNTISSSNSGKTILIAAHDGTINAIRASFTGENIGIVDQTHHAHDFVGRFVYEDGKATSFEEVFANS
jgi:broad specificity phosphatase PhoE